MKWIIVTLAFTGTDVRYYPAPGSYKTYIECKRVLDKEFNPYQSGCYMDVRTQ